MTSFSKQKLMILGRARTESKAPQSMIDLYLIRPRFVGAGCCGRSEFWSSAPRGHSVVLVADSGALVVARLGVSPCEVLSVNVVSAVPVDPSLEEALSAGAVAAAGAQQAELAARGNAKASN
eukprot:3067382-Amphidinium_carterae.1